MVSDLPVRPTMPPGRVLDQTSLNRGEPLVLRTDNGPEFSNGLFRAWSRLNDCLFQSLYLAVVAVSEWRTANNVDRPQSRSGHIPTTRFAVQHDQRAGNAAQLPSTHRSIE